MRGARLSSPRGLVRRRWLWTKLPFLFAASFLMFGYFLIHVFEPEQPKEIQFSPVRASNGLFVSMQSYLIESDAELRNQGSTTNENDLILVVLGMGDFTASAQNFKDERMGLAPQVPQLMCEMRLKGSGQTVESIGPAQAHTRGTAFEGAISSRGTVRYFGERALMLSCGLSSKVESRLRRAMGHYPSSGEAAHIAEFRLVGIDSAFDSGWQTPRWFLPSSVHERHRNNMALCSTALFDFTGSRWLTEWVLYHRLVLGFHEIHLYVAENGSKTMKTVAHLAQTYDWITIHNWTSVLNLEENGLDPVYGVGRSVPRSQGYEHAQRLLRTDCYLRNRGKRWVTIIDPDEFLFTKSNSITAGELADRCEQAQTAVCRFKSVTAYPVRVNGDRMFLRSLDPRCEKRCKEQFNCGDYYYGREKYMVRVSSKSPMPWTMLAIHSISDNLDYSKTFGNHVLPRTDAFVKHFNPNPYKSEHGLPTDNAMSCEFSTQGLDAIAAAIKSDTALDQLYESDLGEEAFLKLDKGDDPNRFA